MGLGIAADRHAAVTSGDFEREALIVKISVALPILPPVLRHGSHLVLEPLIEITWTSPTPPMLVIQTRLKQDGSMLDSRPDYKISSRTIMRKKKFTCKKIVFTNKKLKKKKFIFFGPLPSPIPLHPSLG